VVVNDFDVLKAIAWWHPKILEPACNIELPQFAERNLRDRLKAPNSVSAGKGLRIGASERPKHARS